MTPEERKRFDEIDKVIRDRNTDHADRKDSLRQNTLMDHLKQHSNTHHDAYRLLAQSILELSDEAKRHRNAFEKHIDKQELELREQNEELQKHTDTTQGLLQAQAIIVEKVKFYEDKLDIMEPALEKLQAKYTDMEAHYQSKYEELAERSHSQYAELEERLRKGGL